LPEQAFNLPLRLAQATCLDVRHSEIEPVRVVRRIDRASTLQVRDGSCQPAPAQVELAETVVNLELLGMAAHCGLQRRFERDRWCGARRRKRC
jgi:hypothetical protein